jgi:hypothetical protein
MWRQTGGDRLHAPRLHSGTRDGAPQVLFSAKLKVAPASLPALLGLHQRRAQVAIEVKSLRREAAHLKEALAETVLENRLLKKSTFGAGGGDT